MGAPKPAGPVLLRWFLRVLPRRFRVAWGEEMLALFRTRRAGLRGGHAVASLWLATVVDLVRVAVAERRRSSFDPSSLSRRRGRRAFRPRPVRRLSGDSSMSTLVLDVRHALRGLLHRPGFTAVVVVTLAVGIGANTAVFSVVDGVLLRPLPYEEPEELVSVWGRYDPQSGFDFPFFPLSVPEYVDYRAQARAVDDVAAYASTGVTLTGGEGDAERLGAARVTPNLFALLGEHPLRGRTFSEAEGRPGAAPVALLEEGTWRTRFGADPEIVGSTVRIDGVPTTVVGVVAGSFDFPSRATRLWLPLPIDPEAPGDRNSHYLLTVGRLAEAVGLERARAEMEGIMSAWQEEYPEIHTGHYLRLERRIDDLVGSVRPALLMLLGAAGLVLLMACANVASVVLARGEGRLREMAIRAALGAPRGRTLRLLVCESLLLSAVGGVLGVAVAWLGVRYLLSLPGDAIPRAGGVALDATVLGFAALATVLTALAFGLLPAWRATGGRLHGHLQAGRRGAGAGGGRPSFRQALVVGQVALGFALVLGAGLMIRGLATLLAVDPGFRSDDTLVVRVALPEADYPESARVALFFRELRERVEPLPGVEKAALSSALPLANDPGEYDFILEGLPEPGPGAPAWNASFSAVGPGFFETMGIDVLRGRSFETGDRAGSPTVGVINETMARRFFRGVDPLGRRIVVSGMQSLGDAAWMTVVGVVEDVRYESLGEEARPAYYTAHAQSTITNDGAFRSMYLVVRTGGDGDPEDLVGPIRTLLGEMDPELPLAEVQTLAEVLDRAVARPRFTASLMALFAAVALVLGGTGIYGVLAHAVARRSREIGIRAALGARPADLVSLVVGQAMALVATGLVLGGVASLGLGRLLASRLPDLGSADVGTYGTVVGVLATVALVAALVPMWRAVRADPLLALRSE